VSVANAVGYPAREDAALVAAGWRSSACVAVYHASASALERRALVSRCPALVVKRDAYQGCRRPRTPLCWLLSLWRRDRVREEACSASGCFKGASRTNGRAAHLHRPDGHAEKATTMNVSTIVAEAWARYGAYKVRVRSILHRIDRMSGRAVDMATAAWGVTAVVCVVAIVVLAGEIATGTSWRAAYGPLLVIAAAAVFATAVFAVLAPAVFGAIAAGLNIRSGVVLRRESRLAERQALRQWGAAEAPPLADALWAVRQAAVSSLPRRRLTEDRRMMEGRIARTIAARYGRHALPGGKLHDLSILTSAAFERFAAGWSGSTEKFLTEAETLDESAWCAALRLGEAARDAKYCPGWVNDLIGSLAAAKLSDVQYEAMCALAGGWEAEPSGLVRTAAQL
jgi:hypothetical protein